MINEGVKAGFGGAAVMSVSTDLEMRLSGRHASDAPAKALERLFGIDLEHERAEPPWKSRQGAARAIVHHAVYAAATAAILERLGDVGSD